MDHAPYLLVVQLWRTDVPLENFVAFENRAADILREHGGKITTVIRPISDDPDVPDEIHQIEFSGEANFLAYQLDPRTIALAAERARVIAKTTVWPVETVPSYPK